MGCLASGAYPPARYLHGDEEAAFLGWAGGLARLGCSARFSRAPAASAAGAAVGAQGAGGALPGASGAVAPGIG